MIRLELTINNTVHRFGTDVYDFNGYVWNPRIIKNIDIERFFQISDKYGSRKRTLNLSLNNNDGVLSELHNSYSLLNKNVTVYLDEGDTPTKKLSGVITEVKRMGYTAEITIGEITSLYMKQQIPDCQIAYDYYSDSGINESWNAVPIIIGNVSRLKTMWIEKLTWRFMIGSGPLASIDKVYFDKVVMYDKTKSDSENYYQNTTDSIKYKVIIWKGSGWADAPETQTHPFTGQTITSVYPGMAYLEFYNAATGEAAEPTLTDGTVPEIYVDVKGISKLTDSTLPERNPAKVLYQLAINPVTCSNKAGYGTNEKGPRGFGLAIPTALIDFSTAITYCENHNLYVDGVIAQTTDASEWFDEFAKYCMASFVEEDGVFKLIVDTSAAEVVASFDDSGETGYECQIGDYSEPAYDKQFNRIRLSYDLNPETGKFDKKPSGSEESPIAENSQYLRNEAHASLIGKWNTEKYEYKYVKDDRTAHIIAQYNYKRNLLQLKTLDIKTLETLPTALDVRSVIYVTSKKHNWNNKLFRINRIKKGETGTTLTVTEYYATVYSNYFIDGSVDTTTGQTSIYVVPEKPTLNSIAVSTKILADGTSRIVLTFNATKPDVNVDRIIFFRKLTSEPETSFAPFGSPSYDGKLIHIWETDAGNYNFRAVSVSPNGVYSKLPILTGDKHYYGQPSSESYLYVPEGDTVAPNTPQTPVASVTFATVTVKCYQNATKAVDMAGFVVYRNTSNNVNTAQRIGSVSCSKDQDGVVFTDIDTSYGVTYYYWIKAYDQTGNLSEVSSVSNSVTTQQALTEIGAGSINNSNMFGTGVVSAAALQDASVTAIKTSIAAINSTTGCLVNGAVWNSSVLGTSVVDANAIANYAVTAAKTCLAAINSSTGGLNDNVVGSNAVSTGAITAVKTSLASINSSTGDLNANTVNTLQLVAGAVTTCTLAAGSVTASKLLIVPPNLNPDPYFQDSSLWCNEGGWFFEGWSSGSAADYIGTKNAIVFGNTTGTAQSTIWFNVYANSGAIKAHAGKTYRFYFRGYNFGPANVGVYFRYLNGACEYISDEIRNINSGCGLTIHSWQGIAPACTKYIQPIIIKYAGAAWSSYAAISDVEISEASTAEMIVDGAITTSKLLVSGVGAALNSDPNGIDSTAWSTMNDGGTNDIAFNQTVTNGQVGNKVIRTWGKYLRILTNVVPVDSAKTYRITALVRNIGTTESVYLRPYYYNINNGWEELTGTGVENVTISDSCTWTRLTTNSFQFPVNVRGGVQILPRWGGHDLCSSQYSEIQDVRLEEVLPSTLIKDGAITTDKIYSGAITSEKIYSGAVTSEKIYSGAITSDKITANAVTSDKIYSGAVTADKIASNSICTCHIKTGSITANLLAVGIGNNKLPNASFYDTCSSGSNLLPVNWSFTNNGAGITCYGLQFASGWQVSGSLVKTFYMFIGCCGNQIEESISTTYIPIAANKRYIASVYTGAHRAYNRISVAFYDGCGNYISEGNCIVDILNSANECYGGCMLSCYKRIYRSVTAPSNASYATFNIIKGPTASGYSESYMFAVMPQFEEAGDYATEPGPWSEGGMTAISGSRIITGKIDAQYLCAATCLAATAGTIGRWNIDGFHIYSYDSTGSGIHMEAWDDGNVGCCMPTILATLHRCSAYSNVSIGKILYHGSCWTNKFGINFYASDIGSLFEISRDVCTNTMTAQIAGWNFCPGLFYHDYFTMCANAGIHSQICLCANHALVTGKGLVSLGKMNIAGVCNYAFGLYMSRNCSDSPYFISGNTLNYCYTLPNGDVIDINSPFLYVGYQATNTFFTWSWSNCYFSFNDNIFIKSTCVYSYTATDSSNGYGVRFNLYNLCPSLTFYACIGGSYTEQGYFGRYSLCSSLIILKMTSLAGSGNRLVYSDSTGMLTNSSSDCRLKKMITSISDEFDSEYIISNLRGVHFYWDQSIARAEHLGSQKEVGFIAQEVQPFIPEAVGINNDGYYSLDITKIVPFVVEAEKDIYNRLKSQKSCIESLESRIAKLESQLNS